MPKVSEEYRQTRHLQILEAATRCFAHNGFHRTSMEDIIRESGLSPGAIYCYFSSKSDMVAEIARERHARESALLAKLAGSPSLAEGLSQLARAFLVILQDPKERERRKLAIQVWAESLRDKRMRNIVERGLKQRVVLAKYLGKAKRSGQLHPEVDVDSLSRVLLALLQGLILQQAWEPDLNVEGYFSTAGSLIENVLQVKARPRHGRKRSS